MPLRVQNDHTEISLTDSPSMMSKFSKLLSNKVLLDHPDISIYQSLLVTSLLKVAHRCKFSQIKRQCSKSRCHTPQSLTLSERHFVDLLNW